MHASFSCEMVRHDVTSVHDFAFFTWREKIPSTEKKLQRTMHVQYKNVHRTFKELINSCIQINDICTRISSFYLSKCIYNLNFMFTQLTEHKICLRSEVAHYLNQQNYNEAICISFEFYLRLNLSYFRTPTFKNRCNCFTPMVFHSVVNGKQRIQLSKFPAYFKVKF